MNASGKGAPAFRGYVKATDERWTVSRSVLALITAPSDRCLIQPDGGEPSPQKEALAWTKVEDVLNKNYTNADVEAARVLCAAMAAHSLKQFPPAWCLAIAPPGSAKTDLLESFRGLPCVHFVDELTPRLSYRGKWMKKGKRERSPRAFYIASGAMV